MERGEGPGDFDAPKIERETDTAEELQLTFDLCRNSKQMRMQNKQIQNH